MVAWMHAAILAWSVATAPAPAMPPPEPMPPPEQVMAIPPALRAQLQQQVIGSGGSERQRLQRLVAFLFDPSGLGMTYAADATLTVAQAYRLRQANCLTFTLLTVALAREAGLEARAQEIDDVVAWRVQDNVVYRFNHVNAQVAIGRMRYTVDVARDEVLARHQPEPIPDQRLLALYYNNRAAELLADDDPKVAAPYMAMTLQLAPRYASGRANAGVLRLRLGDLRGAERNYLQALALDPTHAGALFNLVTLYRSQGDEARRARFQQRLEKVQQKDPYFQFLLAMDDEKRGDYAGAVQHYRRAIRLYHGDPRFYLGLARVYRQLGEERHARRALQRADVLGRNADADHRARVPLRN
ncbi:MAG: tetratricopeptide repeat protein [Rhodanobacter sp.]|jgi:tetratricopeptide (TPR) repeat protein